MVKPNDSIGRHEFDALRAADARRQDDLRACEVHRLDDLRAMERHYQSKLRKAESKRLNAIREVDAAATVLSNTRAELMATALAEKVAAAAGTLVTQVEQTKIAAATAVDATTETLSGRIKPLEDARYEQAGRSGGRTDVTKVIWALLGALVPVVIYFLLRAGI